MLGPRGGKQLRTFARVGAVGIELAASTVIGFLGGRWLDQKLDSDPYLALLGLFLGVTAGFRSLIQTAKRESQRMRSEAPEPRRNHRNEPRNTEPDDD